jgi:hypothetical protein
MCTNYNITSLELYCVGFFGSLGLINLKQFIHVSPTFEKPYSRFCHKCQTIDWLGVYTVIKIVPERQLS